MVQHPMVSMSVCSVLVKGSVYPDLIVPHFVVHMESYVILVKPFPFLSIVNLVTPVVTFVGE